VVYILSNKFKSLFIIYPLVWIVVSTIWYFFKKNLEQLLAHYIVIVVYLILVGSAYLIEKKIQEKRKKTKEG